MSQAEKETVVDFICKKYLPKDYMVQKFDNVDKLCEILNKNENLIESDLVGLIKKYKIDN